MSFDWNDYWTLANDLVSEAMGQPLREARCRCAISRAYYAALLIGRAKISMRSGEKPGKYHAWTSKTFAIDPDPQAKRISAHLKRLKKAREKADYRNHIKNIENELQSALLQARQIIDNVNRLPDDPNTPSSR